MFYLIYLHGNLGEVLAVVLTPNFGILSFALGFLKFAFCIAMIVYCIIFNIEEIEVFCFSFNTVKSIN